MCIRGMCRRNGGRGCRRGRLRSSGERRSGNLAGAVSRQEEGNELDRENVANHVLQVNVVEQYEELRRYIGQNALLAFQHAVAQKKVDDYIIADVLLKHLLQAA